MAHRHHRKQNRHRPTHSRKRNVESLPPPTMTAYRPLLSFVGSGHHMAPLPVAGSSTSIPSTTASTASIYTPRQSSCPYYQHHHNLSMSNNSIVYARGYYPPCAYPSHLQHPQAWTTTSSPARFHSETASKRWREAETASARERRIFGGEECENYVGGEGGEEDLRGSMLEVVLNLFNGVDYED